MVGDFMLTSKLYIGNIIGLVRRENTKGASYGYEVIKTTCLKRIDFYSYQDIFDKKVYDVRYKNGNYLNPYSLVKYNDLYKEKIKTKRNIKKSIDRNEKRDF